MPSLSAKAEPAVATDPAEMSKTMVVMMEKKIRNLEKRKGRLEEYRTKQTRGQTLSEEQLKAVAKVDDVLSQIDLLQDLIKQITQYGTEVVKQQKRQHKKERFEHIDSERKRFSEILHVQSVLNALGEEETRQAFAEGKEGAVKLEEQELKHLDELYKIINPERGNEGSLNEQVKSSSEHLQSVLDGREKAVGGTTYRRLNELITKVKGCTYFTESGKPTADEPAEETSPEEEFVVVNTEEVPHADSEEVQSSLPPEIPVEQEPVASTEQVYEQQPAQQPAQQQASAMPQQPPTDPSKTVEEIVDIQGSFNFIQDSVIDVDSPSHVDPAVVSVHQMPAQHFQQQPIVSHSQPENSAYTQQTNDTGAYQQYDMQAPAPNTFGQSDSHQQVPVSEETAPTSNQTRFNTQSDALEDEHHGKFGNGMTFESSSLKQQDKPSHSDSDYSQTQHRGQGGQMRRGSGGGYRGGRGGGGFSNGFGGGRGGYRGSSDRSGSGYRGDTRQTGGDRPHHAGGNNGFNPENRRGGRGGQRGSNSGGFRGGNSAYSNNGRRGFRGQHQQPPTNA